MQLGMETVYALIPCVLRSLYCLYLVTPLMVLACVLNAIKDTIDKLMEWYICPDPISKGPYFNDNGKLTEVKRMKQVGVNW